MDLLLLLLLFLPFCCVVPLEELVCFLLMSTYLFFESRLFPTLFLVLGWCYQPGRVQAGSYLLFYTLLVSLPLLVGISFIYDFLGSLCLFLLSGNDSLACGVF